LPSREGHAARGIAFQKHPISGAWRCAERDLQVSFIDHDEGKIAFLNWCDVPTEQIWNRFEAVVNSASLFVPGQPELVGPRHNREPNCWECSRQLGFDEGILGCLECRYFACACGACLCFFRGGWVYPGKSIPPYAKKSYFIPERRVLVGLAEQLLTILKERANESFAEEMRRRFHHWPGHGPRVRF
jgi:hypothetical protein